MPLTDTGWYLLKRQGIAYTEEVGGSSPSPPTTPDEADIAGDVDLFTDERPSIDLEFGGQLIFWRGPSPFVFLPVPEAESADIAAVATLVTYGWGVIPVSVRIGNTAWTTSLFPRDGRYLVPIKVAVQRAEGLEVGDEVTATMRIALPDFVPPDR